MVHFFLFSYHVPRKIWQPCYRCIACRHARMGRRRVRQD
jgi:hypothetical protein